MCVCVCALSFRNLQQIRQLRCLVDCIVGKPNEQVPRNTVVTRYELPRLWWLRIKICSARSNLSRERLELIDQRHCLLHLGDLDELHRLNGTLERRTKGRIQGGEDLLHQVGDDFAEGTESGAGSSEWRGESKARQSKAK